MRVDPRVLARDSASVLTVLRFANAGLGLGATAVLASRLGPAEYGLLVSVVGLDGLSNVAAEWTTTPHLVKELSNGETAGVPEAEHRAVASVAALRLLTGPIFTGALLAGYALLIGGPHLDLLPVAFLVWLPSLGYFSTAVGPVLLAKDRLHSFVLISQASGAAWSIGAIAIGLLTDSVILVGAAFAAAGGLSIGLNLAAAHRAGVLRDLVPSRSGLQDGWDLWRTSAGSAVSQTAAIAPWRLLPAAVALVMRPAAAGEVLASVRYWEQVSVPMTSLAVTRLGATAKRGGAGLERTLRVLLGVTVVVTVLAVPASVAYRTYALGSGYRQLGSNLAPGLGMGLVATVLLAGPSLLLAAGVPGRRLRFLGAGATVGLLVGVLILLSFDPDSMAATTCMTVPMTVGSTIGLLMAAPQSRTTNTAIVGVGFVLAVCSIAAGVLM